MDAGKFLYRFWDAKSGSLREPSLCFSPEIRKPTKV